MRREIMQRITFNMQKDICDDCSLALKRFIGHMDGVESIEAEDGRLVIDFNSSKISMEELSRITKDSIEKLGYKLTE
ncbi:MAG: heavy-metal-associated domain-containing protein [Nitrospirae bacterium]|nr:heavy-metal-associated domain-containing protein [Nitrospirota bacterium]